MAILTNIKLDYSSANSIYYTAISRNFVGKFSRKFVEKFCAGDNLEREYGI